MRESEKYKIWDWSPCMYQQYISFLKDNFREKKYMRIRY